jgi:thymidylate synthase
MLGCGYNLAGYAILTHIFAHLTGLEVGELIHTIGNAHIYLNHTDAIKEQLTRPCFPLPTLEISDRLADIDDIKFEDFKLVNYKYHPSIKAEVAI